MKRFIVQFSVLAVLYVDVLELVTGGRGGSAGPESCGGHAAGEAEAANLRHYQRPRGHRAHREEEQELHSVDVSRVHQTFLSI